MTLWLLDYIGLCCIQLSFLNNQLWIKLSINDYHMPNITQARSWELYNSLSFLSQMHLLEHVWCPAGMICPWEIRLPVSQFPPPLEISWTAELRGELSIINLIRFAWQLSRWRANGKVFSLGETSLSAHFVESFYLVTFYSFIGNISWKIFSLYTHHFQSYLWESHSGVPCMAWMNSLVLLEGI